MSSAAYTSHAYASTTAGPSSPSPSSPSIDQTALSPRKSSLRGFQNASPRTPSPRPRRRRKGKGKGPAVRDYGREDAREAFARNAAARHSHGLSWNSTTRDSVVDNLLFGLNNFGSEPAINTMAGGGHEEEERHRYLSSLASQFSTSRPPVRSRGHTHSSSTSEFDRTMADSPASKLSMASSKGRRSNSSTNFGQNLAGRMKSNGKTFGIGRTSSDLHRTKPSDGSSIDYGYGAVLETTNRLAWNGKSMSMDHIHADSGADAPSVLERGRPVPSIHSKYEPTTDSDAAPEPSIAGGPRKMQNPTATGPVYVNAASSKSRPSTLRKITTQQDLRSAGHGLPSPPIPQDIRNQAANFVRTSSMAGTLPPPSAKDLRAPSPAVASRRREPSPPRDKPGFFKRVFGGSSARAVSTPVERPGPNQNAQQNGNERANAATRSASQTSAAPQAQNEAKATNPSSSAPPPSLNKKPSSFFRRRKKSTSEAMPPPPLPIAPSSNNLSVQAAVPSPSLSSLRKVMDPFLSQETATANGKPGEQQGNGFRPNTADSKNEDSEDPDIFHSGYTPPPDASLGSRHPISREHSARPSLDKDSDANAKMKVKKRKPDPLVTSSSQGFSQQPSTGTLRDESDGPPAVSPLSDFHPAISRPQTPPSRMSVREDDTAPRPRSPLESPNQDLRDFSASNNVSLDMNDEGWIVTRAIQDRPASKNTERLRLQPTPSEERLNASVGHSPPNGMKSATVNKENVAPDGLPTAASEPMLSDAQLTLPTLQVSSSIASRTSSEPTIIQVPSEFHDEGAEYRERARRIFEGDEEDVPKYDAAAWMGERNILSTRTLQAYMQLFDFSGVNILTSLRMLCMRLILRGETQQFDRIITALSARWCECNTRHGFKAQDVVHTIIYSLILLNTDLHLADIGEKMSRSAYVKNTLPTIKRVVNDAAPGAFDETLKVTPQSHRPSLPWSDSNPSIPSSPVMPRSMTPVERSDSSFSDTIQAFAPTSNKRLSIRPGVSRQDSDNAATPDSGSGGPSNTLVNFPWMGSMRGWELEIENILKSFFNSIKSEPLPLHGAGVADLPNGNRNLSVVDLNNTLKRTGSVVSKAPSDNMSFRSKQDFRTMTMRWQNRGISRSRPKLYPPSTVGSSRTSFDDGSGFWSPAQSSKFSFSKTLTSASVGSFSHFSPTDSFKHSTGFANALSQAIIREEHTGGDSTETFSVPGGLLEDESLTLEGAPWAKEGLVKHKHHLETQDRKAKDRNWNECFAVISKGKLTLFAFNTSGKTQSMGRKNHFSKSGKAASVTGAKVGGGDWMENAEQLDVFVLRQTIASTLPPPGYSKARPHVWALSLPSGAVHLFQVGTPEIAEEYMTTANYWSARLSKEPLSGGVSNIEYGWSDNIVNTALVERSENFQHPPPSMQNRQMSHGHSISTDRPRRSSLQSSVRNSFDTGFGGGKSKLPGDKVTINDWEPPSQSMMASQLMEVDQLRQLTAYVKGQEEELERHNELKHAIELAYSPRHPNFNKSMNNWQRKSDYLLREIVKFRTYIDSLTAAQKAKDAFYAKKAEGRLSPVAKDDDNHFELPNISNNMRDFPTRDIHTSG